MNVSFKVLFVLHGNVQGGVHGNVHTVCSNNTYVDVDFATGMYFDFKNSVNIC